MLIKISFHLCFCADTPLLIGYSVGVTLEENAGGHDPEYAKAALNLFHCLGRTTVLMQGKNTLLHTLFVIELNTTAAV